MLQQQMHALIILYFLLLLSTLYSLLPLLLLLVVITCYVAFFWLTVTPKYQMVQYTPQYLLSSPVFNDPHKWIRPNRPERSWMRVKCLRFYLGVHKNEDK